MTRGQWYLCFLYGEDSADLVSRDCPDKDRVDVCRKLVHVVHGGGGTDCDVLLSPGDNT